MALYAWYFIVIVLLYQSECQKVSTSPPLILNPDMIKLSLAVPLIAIFNVVGEVAEDLILIIVSLPNSFMNTGFILSP